jgi:hypothetical protein
LRRDETRDIGRSDARVRTVVDIATGSTSNIAFARIAPPIAPAIWTAT